MTEGKVVADPVAIDAPGGFLFEWWSVFWDIFIARTNEKHSEVAVTYIETQQIKSREHQQQLQMQRLQLMHQRYPQMKRRDGFELQSPFKCNKGYSFQVSKNQSWWFNARLNPIQSRQRS